MALTLAEAYDDLALVPLAPSLPLLPFSPDVPIVAYPSGKAWRCTSGEHHYHRSEARARWCAWASLPMVSVGWPVTDG